MQTYWNKRKCLHKKEFKSQGIGLVHQHGRRFIVLEHQFGCLDVMWKRSIRVKKRFLKVFRFLKLYFFFLGSFILYKETFFFDSVKKQAKFLQDNFSCTRFLPGSASCHGKQLYWNFQRWGNSFCRIFCYGIIDREFHYRHLISAGISSHLCKEFILSFLPALYGGSAGPLSLVLRLKRWRPTLCHASSLLQEIISRSGELAERWETLGTSCICISQIPDGTMHSSGHQKLPHLT